MGIFNFQLFILGDKYLFFILAANPIVFCYKKFSDKNLKGFCNWNFLVKLFELTSLLTSNLKEAAGKVFASNRRIGSCLLSGSDTKMKA